MGRRDLQSLSPRLRGTKRTLNMYIWRDNSVRSHDSREAGGESQALRGIIQFGIFQFRVRRRIRFSRVRGFILRLYMSSQHKFIMFSPFLSLFFFVFSSSFFHQFSSSFIPSWLRVRRRRSMLAKGHSHTSTLPSPAASVTPFSFMFHLAVFIPFPSQHN